MAQSKKSDHNLIVLNTKQYAEGLRATIQAGKNFAIFGRRGGGKTEIAKSEIRSTSVKHKGQDRLCREVYLNLSILERVDLGGYPDIVGVSETEKERRKYVKFLLPAYLERLIEGDDPVVLLLDEVDKADNSLQAPLLELTQFRSVNGRQLPNLYAVIMTGNLIAEGSQRPSLPLLDRAEKYILEADGHQWLEWAGKSGNIHPSISAFINDNPVELFGELNEDENYADASPRGWHNASQLVKFGEEHRWSTDLMSNKVSGCVGKKAGMRFKHYFDHYQHLLPLVGKIIDGKDVLSEYKKLEKTKQVILNMVLFSKLAGIIKAHMEKGGKRGPLPKEGEIVGKFIDNANVDAEMVLIAARCQIGIDLFMKSGLDDIESWNKVLKSVQKKLG